MSGMGGQLVEVGLGLREWLVSLGQKARRIAAGPALVRTIAALAALAGLAVALPPDIAFSPRFGVAVPIAAGVGLFPRTRWVGAVLLFITGAWLVNSIAFQAEPVQPWQVAALGAALYLVHTAAALAAVLPYDSVVGGGVLLRWAGRTAGVLGASLGLGLAAMAVLGQLRPVQSVVGPIVGSVVAAGLAGLLAWHLRRRI